MQPADHRSSDLSIAKSAHRRSAHERVPEGWEIEPLGRLFEFKNGVNADKECYGSGTKFINVLDVLNNVSLTADKISGSVVLPEVQIQSNLVQKGDVLFNRTSETPDEIGMSTVYLDEIPVVFGGFVIRGRSTNQRLDNNYKKYCFTAMAVRKQIISKGQGAIRANIGQADLEQVEMLVPQLEEQRRIANLLSIWDTAIEKTQALISEQEFRKKALMQQLLTGKRRLPGFNASWKTFEYERLLQEVKRPIEWDEHQRYDLISVRRRSGGLFHRESLYGHQILTKDLRTAHTGDFLMSKMQIVHGASGLTTPEYDGMKISGSYVAVVARDPELLDMRFFNWLSKMPQFYHQTYVSSYGVHIEKMTFDFASFMTLRVSMPTLEEQIAIVKVLETADKELDLLVTKLQLLKDQKSSLMQKLLTGQIRVKAQ
jgi:type I restriction enzyme S subunit